jgi:hypothetical protein
MVRNIGYMKRIYLIAPVLLAFFFSLTPALAFAAPNSGSATNTSRNWSGYVSTGGTFTGVTGSWTVPSVTASASAEADATWVGIGGVSSNDLIQIGTQAITQNNVTTYEAWYELLPTASTAISMQVNAGDSMSASISQIGTGSWQVSIRDNTNNQSFSTTLSYNSSLSSAEWIEEMPSDQIGYIPLDNFGTISFTNASATENGSSITPAQANTFPLTMITNAGQALAIPSSLGADGASFIVSRSSAASAITPHTVQRDGRGGFRRSGNGASGSVPQTHIQIRQSFGFHTRQFGRMLKLNILR